ncbi:hypothetical protein L1D15_21335 [Vibrio sp. Isolate25]|uniref:hypothetical protein n=1 Tax=Vibrio sp. Isolate25 TaxID=2908535 RepID=UPI001EFE9BB8|nr:hypothetical protein [Vibrio sp. Isolate25]MCG9599236.1 hypothetical protein [Vibrio sp. Isolate25]
MKYPDDIDFLYFLENHGWSTCLVYVGGEIYEMGPTHIFENPIEVLLNGLIEMIQGADEVNFKWHDEPGEYVWSIKRNKEQKHKMVVSISGCTRVNASGKAKHETLDFEVKLKLFSVCVLKQMEKIRDLMTEKSFKENREGEFPYTVFKEFQRAYDRAYS